MKNLYLSIFAVLVCLFNVNAQVTLTKATHEPSIGDMDKRNSYDSTTAIPKQIGLNQVWNFTSMTAQSTYTQSYISPGSAMGNALFPTATIAMNDVGSSRYEFHRSTSTDFEFVGQVDPVSTETLVFSNTGILRSYPISYGSLSVDNWVALQTSGTGTMSMTGTASVAATGTGTVILPNGNVHPNCLQVIETITLAVSSGTMNMSGYFINVFFYEATNKFPVFEYSYESVGSVKFSASASSDALLAGLNEINMSNGMLDIYPNPVKDELFISSNRTENPARIQVMDAQGREVINEEFSNSIKVESLQQGLYIMKLNYNGKVIYRRFVKVN